MKWSFKPHQTTIQIPDDFDPANTLDVDDCVSSDLEAAQKVFKLFPHWVFCNGVLYVYNQDTWMWDNTHTAYIAIIMSLSDRLYVSKTNKDGSSYVCDKDVVWQHVEPYGKTSDSYKDNVSK